MLSPTAKVLVYDLVQGISWPGADIGHIDSWSMSGSRWERLHVKLFAAIRLEHNLIRILSLEMTKFMTAVITQFQDANED